MNEEQAAALGSTASFDQMAAAFGGLARNVAQYWRSLSAEEMPEDLVEELTLQAAGCMWHRALWPSGAP